MTDATLNTRTYYEDDARCNIVEKDFLTRVAPKSKIRAWPL